MKNNYLLVLIILLASCNPNYYNTISLLDSIDGDGYYVFKDFKFKGSIVNDLPNGNGTLIYNSGVMIEGFFKNGVLHDDEAHYSIPNLGIINGKVVDGKLTYGHINYENGQYYKGNINSYVPSGKGMMVYSNGDIKIGIFNNRSVSGEGYYYKNSTNTTAYGNFSNGELHGDVSVVDGSGKVNGEIYDNGTLYTNTILSQRASKKLLEDEENKLAPTEKLITQTVLKGKSITEQIELVKQLRNHMLSGMQDNCSQEILGITDFRFFHVATGGKHLLRDGYYYSWDYGFPSSSDGYGLGLDRYFDYTDERAAKFYEGEFGFYVALNMNASKDAVKRALEKKYALITMCEDYRQNKSSFTQDKVREFEVKQRALEQSLGEVNEQQSMLQIRLTTINKTLQNDRATRINETKEKLRNDLDEKAEAKIEQRKSYCEMYPDGCGCIGGKAINGCANVPKGQCACTI